MNPMIKAIGVAWLRWLKWPLSRILAGRAWGYHVGQLAEPQDVVGPLPIARLEALTRQLSGLRRYWRPDPLAQLWDRVYPPAQLLERGGDDCDGWAMFHAQAVEAFMPAGWRSAIGSYLADPWHLSHHVALAYDPEGQVWAIQPQPTKEQADLGVDLDLVLGPFGSSLEALEHVASLYRARVVWHDLRASDGSLINR